MYSSTLTTSGFLATGLLYTASAVHHSWVNNGARVPKTDTQVGKALNDLGEHVEQSLEYCECTLTSVEGRHGRQDVLLRAEKRSATAPLSETAHPPKVSHPTKTMSLAFSPSTERKGCLHPNALASQQRWLRAS